MKLEFSLTPSFINFPFSFLHRFLQRFYVSLRLLTKQLPFQEIPAAQLPAAKAAGKLPQLPTTVPTDCSELVAQCASAFLKKQRGFLDFFGYFSPMIVSPEIEDGNFFL